MFILQGLPFTRVLFKLKTITKGTFLAGKVPKYLNILMYLELDYSFLDVYIFKEVEWTRYWTVNKF